MVNGDETLASHTAAADQTLTNGGVADGDLTATTTAAAHPIKSYAAVAAGAELEALRAAKLDLEEKLAAASSENLSLAAEAHRLEGLFSQARDDITTTEHAASTFEQESESLRAEVKRLQDFLAAEKSDNEDEKRKAAALAAELEAARLEKLAREKEIEALKASASAAAADEDKDEEAAAASPKELAWQGMVAAAAVGAAATAAVAVVYLHLKR